MLENLPTLAHLLKVLQQVPYLASKNVYKVAAHFLEMKPEQMVQFCTILDAAKKRLKKCTDCFYWQETSSACVFCSSGKRDQQVICVVESWARNVDY